MTSLLESLQQKLEEQGIVSGSLVKRLAGNHSLSNFWSRNQEPFGFNPIVVDKDEVLLYLGIVSVPTEEVTGKTTSDTYLAHKFLSDKKIVYLRVAADSFLKDFVCTFEVIDKE